MPNAITHLLSTQPGQGQFAGRMLYRFWVIGNISTASGQPQMLQSPLTFFIFGLVAGYYIVYHIGILVHARDRAAVT